MTKLIVALSSFANASKKRHIRSYRATFYLPVINLKCSDVNTLFIVRIKPAEISTGNLTVLASTSSFHRQTFN